MGLLKLVAGFVAAVAFLFAVMYGMRWFSNTTTPLMLQSPKPGVTCASMVTSDGAALSCWKD